MAYYNDGCVIENLE